MHDEILMNIMLSLNGIKDILYKTAPWYQSMTPFVTAGIGALLAYLLGQHKDKIRSKKEQVKIKKALFHEINMIKKSAKISFIAGCDIEQIRSTNKFSPIGVSYGSVLKVIFYDKMFHDAIPELNDKQIEAIIYLYSDYEILNYSINNMLMAIKGEHYMLDKYNSDIVFYSAKVLNSAAVILNDALLVEPFSLIDVADSIGYTNEGFDKQRRAMAAGSDK
jgi:hypothetical protein